MNEEIPGHYRDEFPHRGKYEHSSEQIEEEQGVEEVEEKPDHTYAPDQIDEQLKDNLVGAHWAKVLREHDIELTEQDVNDMTFLDPEQAEEYITAILKAKGIEDTKRFFAEHDIPYKLPSDIEEAIQSKPHYAAHKDTLLRDEERAKKIRISIVRDLDVFDKVAQTTQMTPFVVQEWRHKIAEDLMNIIVAFDDKQAVGRVNINWTGSDNKEVAEKIGTVPTIEDLSVNEEYRGVGIGMRLMLACDYTLEERIKEHPNTPKTLALLVDQNNMAARNLYEKLNYEYVPGSYGTKLLMVKN